MQVNEKGKYFYVCKGDDIEQGWPFFTTEKEANNYKDIVEELIEKGFDVFVTKKHWLHHNCRFIVDIKEEHRCSLCVHTKVCKNDMSAFCYNYDFGSSLGRSGCGQCIHRFTSSGYTADKDVLLCFMCKHYKAAMAIALFCGIVVTPEYALKCWHRKWESDIEEPCTDCDIKAMYDEIEIGVVGALS